MQTILEEEAGVVSNTWIAERTHQLDLATGIAHLVKPGQFVRLGSDSQSSLRRPFSVYSVLSGNSAIRIIFREVGRNTRDFYPHLKPGDKLGISGPYGQPIGISSQVELFFLVGGGCGLVPWYPLGQQIRQETKADIRVVAGFPTSAQIFGEVDFTSQLCAEFNVATDDGSRGFQGTAVGLFQKILFSEDGLPEVGKINVFACGPVLMMQAVALFCRQKGISCFVSLEAMMGCGLGDCKGCAFSVTTSKFPKHVCQDGPVFPAKEVCWDALTRR